MFEKKYLRKIDINFFLMINRKKVSWENWMDKVTDFEE